MNQAAPIAESAAALEAEADRAAARGDAGSARELCSSGPLPRTPTRAETWLKLAAMCRATRRPRRRAGCGVRRAARRSARFPAAAAQGQSCSTLWAGADEAGETYGYALAQAPATIPPHLPHRSRMRAPAASRSMSPSRRLGSAEAAADAAARLRRSGAASRASSPTFCARPGPTTPSRPIFIIPACASASFTTATLFPWLAALEAATDGDHRGFPAGDGGRAGRARPLYPISRRRAAAAMGGAQPQPRLDRDPPRPERRDDRGQCPPLPGDDGAAPELDQPSVAGRGPNAMFSLLAPGAHIPPHTGVANTRLVCHLPLIVPAGLLVPGRRRDARLGGRQGLGVRRHDRA